LTCAGAEPQDQLRSLNGVVHAGPLKFLPVIEMLGQSQRSVPLPRFLDSNSIVNHPDDVTAQFPFRNRKSMTLIESSAFSF
jgi:hypothetical protein